MDWKTGSPAHTVTVAFGAGMLRAMLDWIAPWCRVVWQPVLAAWRVLATTV
jgi:hypothetical protein